MSIRKKPDQAVPVLLARLDKAKEYTQKTGTDDRDRNSLNSKFKEIEDELNKVNDLLPRIRHWEKKITEQFCELEQALDDDVFKDPKKVAEVPHKLDCIKGDIKHLKSLIPMVDMQFSRQFSMMSFKPTNQPTEEGDNQEASQEWLDLNSRIEEEIIMSAAVRNNLLASFHCVESSRVKICLLCLSIFPENSVIKKRPLIYWWIGEGLVAKTKSKTAEEVGEEVFQELLNEGFIKPRKENQNALSVNSFIVDPWIRRMLILAAKENRFFMFIPSEGRLSNGFRRAFLCQGNESYGVSDGKVEELLTVFNVDKQYLGTRPDWQEWLEKLHQVEVLQLGRWKDSDKYHIEVENQEMLKGLGSQKHLKYLSLRGISRIENLPRSIVKLRSLKILDLRACHNLEKLPQGISALKNLTHLDVSECYLLESMPRGLEHLVSLQVLKGFVIGRPGKNSCKIHDLNGLKHLRKLAVRIGNENEAQREDQLGSLANFSDLRILTISWGVFASETGLEYLKSLPKSLRKLDLRFVPLTTAPQWMSPRKLENLEKLYITGGRLNSLSQEDSEKWKVKYLRLKYLKNLKIDEAKLESLFPEYLRLEKISCHKNDRDVIRVKETKSGRS